MLNAADLILKFLTPLLALAAGGLAVRGTTWDDIRGRPTRFGWWTLMVVALTMIVSISSIPVSEKVAERARKKALGEQAESFQAMIDQASKQNRDASAQLASRQEELTKQSLSVANSTRLSQMRVQWVELSWGFAPTHARDVRSRIKKMLPLVSDRDSPQLKYAYNMLSVNGQHFEEATHYVDALIKGVWVGASGVALRSDRGGPLFVPVDKLDSIESLLVSDGRFTVRSSNPPISASFFYDHPFYIITADIADPPSDVQINVEGEEFRGSSHCQGSWERLESSMRSQCTINLRFLR